MDSTSIISMFGKPLARQQVDSGLWLAKLSSVRGNYERDPNPAHTIDYAEVLANGLRIHEAILVLTKGIKHCASDHNLYRHRGHRYVSARLFDKAIADFESAIRLISTLPASESLPQPDVLFDLWYHLGIAWFLKEKFELAATAFGECLKQTRTDEETIACMDWYYLALRREGRDNEARLLLDRFDPTMDAGDSHAYYKRLAVYAGIRDAKNQKIESLMEDESDDIEYATLAFGIGHWHLLENRWELANQLFAKALEKSAWSAFGYIAAEAELYRSRLL